MEEDKKKLQKGLNNRHIFFIALGSAIGTGLFYGSAKAIEKGGPAVLIAYLIGGIGIFMVMRALGEMAVHNPISGSFGRYATMYLGSLAGFITGWTYVFEMVLVCLADITAFSIYMHFWLPDISPWIWTLGITIIIAIMNLSSVKIFGELEFWLSLIKVLAIIAMIIAGLVIIFFGFGAANFESIGFSNLWKNSGFMPNGIEGVIASFSVVMFAFGGVEIIGITAREAKDTDKSIPKAINAVPARILLFYVMTLTVLMSLFPWNKIGTKGSPFVSIFESLGIQYAAHILNVVIISAAISAVNSDMFGAGRMMYGLSKDGQAPKSFGYLTKKGVPIVPILVMLITLLVGVVLNYYYPKQIFFIIASIATFATVWVWLMILLSQFKMRSKMSSEEVKRLKFPVPFWPIGPILAILFMMFVILILGFFKDTRIALLVGVVWVILLVVCYFMFNINKKATKI